MHRVKGILWIKQKRSNGALQFVDKRGSEWSHSEPLLRFSGILSTPAGGRDKGDHADVQRRGGSRTA
jgi:hypothetical protein